MTLVEAASEMLHYCAADEGMHDQHGLIKAVRDKDFVHSCEGSIGSMTPKIIELYL